MGHCLRISPLIMLVLVAVRARWFLGLITGSAPRATAATASTTATVGTSGAKAAGAGAEIVSQLFVWFFVLVALMLLGGLVSLAVGEIKLRREIRGSRAFRRAERAHTRETSPWYQRD